MRIGAEPHDLLFDALSPPVRHIQCQHIRILIFRLQSVVAQRRPSEELPKMKAEYENEADRTTALIEIWREVLSPQHLDENSDLFEAGGTSMQVLEIIGRVSEVMDVDVRLRQIFEHTTPKSLSVFLGASPLKSQR
ncbi:acyl carrier protein [Nonomuraea sp. B19D2]|uniref:acyl carrier protein n=1 Tax=Nonomuraea sp. B19D2 TaxID=3159561 RepID=UPI0032DBBB67